MKTGTQKTISSLSLSLSLSLCVTNPKHLSLPGHGWQRGGIRQCYYYFPSCKMGFSDRAPKYKRKEQVCSSPSLTFVEFQTPFLFFPFGDRNSDPRRRHCSTTTTTFCPRKAATTVPLRIVPLSPPSLVRSGGGDFRFEKKGKEMFSNSVTAAVLGWVGSGEGGYTFLCPSPLAAHHLSCSPTKRSLLPPFFHRNVRTPNRFFPP